MSSDIHALSGAYAVDALDDTERAEFERHLASCASCRAEVQSFRETTAIMAEAEAEQTPPESLRANVLAGISQVRPFPPETAEIEAPEPVAPVVTLGGRTLGGRTLGGRTLGGRTLGGRTLGRRVQGRRMLPTLVAAAAVLVLITAGALTWHPWSSGHAQTTLAEQVLEAPDAVKLTQKLPGGKGQLTLVRSASLKRAVMVGDGVPEPASGTTYQLWLQQPGQGMVSAGLMPDSHEPTLLTGDAATAKAAAISVEPETGSARPTGPVVALFSLRQASGGNSSA